MDVFNYFKDLFLIKLLLVKSSQLTALSSQLNACGCEPRTPWLEILINSCLLISEAILLCMFSGVQYDVL